MSEITTTDIVEAVARTEYRMAPDKPVASMSLLGEVSRLPGYPFESNGRPCRPGRPRQRDWHQTQLLPAIATAIDAGMIVEGKGPLEYLLTDAGRALIDDGADDSEPVATTEYRITERYGSARFERAKAALKRAGARWQPDTKTWIIDTDDITEQVAIAARQHSLEEV